MLSIFAKQSRIGAAAAIVLSVVSAVPAQALDETMSIPSRAISDEEFLRGEDGAAAAITITGHLSGPDKDAPVPVVILLHGTDGPKSGAAGTWRAFLNEKGITTLRLDSYSGRGLENASSNQGSIGQFAQIYDAYRAADALAGDPRIDASRIVIMGFSRGGTAALYSALSRFQAAFGPKRAELVAHLSFYPACNFELKNELKVTSALIRLFHGSEDDWTPAAPCRAYIERLRSAKVDAEMTEYAGARHGFDNVSNPSFYSDSTNQTSRNCFRREVDGQLINAATGKPFSYRDACVEYGPSSQYQDVAARAAQAEVSESLTALLAISAK